MIKQITKDQFINATPEFLLDNCTTYEGSENGLYLTYNVDGNEIEHTVFFDNDLIIEQLKAEAADHAERHAYEYAAENGEDTAEILVNYYSKNERKIDLLAIEKTLEEESLAEVYAEQVDE